MNKEIVQFPNLGKVFDAISIYADQNSLTAKEVAEIFIAGGIAAQIEGRVLTPFPIMWGFLETAAQPSTPTQEAGNGHPQVTQR